MKLKAFLLGLCVALVSTVSAQQKVIDSLESVLKRAKGNEKIEILQKLSTLYLNESSQKAFKTAFQAYHYATFTNNSSILSDSYFTLGILHFKTSDFDSAKIYLNKALKTSVTNAQTAEILDNLGTIYKDLSSYDSSLLFHNQALRLQQVLGNRDAVAVCYKNIGNVYMQMAKYEDALDYYKLSMEEYELSDDKKSAASLCNNISSAYVGMNRYADALSYLTKAVDIQTEIGDKKGVAYTLNGIGNFYFRLKIYDKAQEYYTKSLELRQSLGDKNDIAASLFNIATVHRDLGNSREALKYYGNALELREQTNNKEAQALILNAIGGTYKNQQQYGKALKNYEDALALNEKVGSRKAIASSYERLGMICRDTAMTNKSPILYKLAVKYYNSAIQEYLSINDSVNAARISNFFGNLHKDFGDFQSAMKLYNSAYGLYAKNELGQAYVLFNQGKLLAEQKSAEAEKYLSDALAKAQNCEEKVLVCDITHSLYLLKKSQGQTEQALNYYEKYVALYDEIEAAKNKERIAELEFESDMKVLEHINENQQLKLNEEISKQTQSKYFIIVLSIILLGIVTFSLLLYRMYAQKKKAFAMLYQKQLEVEAAYEDIKTVNETLEQKNTQIHDSLTYAKRIQKAIFPSQEDISTIFPKNFIFNLPKGVVSGDFYWMSEVDGKTFIAVVDCTGHGVPGACMSMVGNMILNQIINEKKVSDPVEILKQLDDEIIKTLRQDVETDTQEDGMTISLIRYDRQKSEICFSGAGQKITVVSDGKPQTYCTSLFPIGGLTTHKQDKQATFKNEIIPVAENTTVYMYTDGFIDQFGAGKNEKFSSQQFENMIADMQMMDMSEQYLHLSRALDSWKGDEKQTDDILIVGISF